MTEPAPDIDFAKLPAPAEGILVTLFITVRKVARSRDFYSRVLGGTVVLDENPCVVRPEVLEVQQGIREHRQHGLQILLDEPVVGRPANLLPGYIGSAPADRPG